MFSSMNDQLSTTSDFIPVQSLIDAHLNHLQNYCLFLDIDGTISEFDIDPQATFIELNTLHHLATLQQFKVPIAAITGRSIADAQRLFKDLDLHLAGTHGLEIRLNRQLKLPKFNPDLNFDVIYKEILQHCTAYKILSIEKKSYAVAIHYRAAPELEQIAHQIAENIVEQHQGLKLNLGKYVVEIILEQADKGLALKDIYHSLELEQHIPIFIGDDRTDESAFKVVNQLGGISIKVGTGPTVALFRIKNVRDTHEFIQLFLEFIKNKKTRQPQVSKINGEQACLN